METIEYFFWNVNCNIVFNGSHSLVTPLRGQWTKFTKILLSERTFFLSFPTAFFLLLHPYTRVHTCVYMCVHVNACVNMCASVPVLMCVCPYVQNTAKWAETFSCHAPPSPQNEGSIVPNLQKACFPCFWGMLWGSGKARLVGNSSLWVRQADHMIKTSCDTSKCFSTRNPGAQEPGEASSNYGHTILFISFISSVSEINHSVWLE